jgi:hypothetical protein
MRLATPAAEEREGYERRKRRCALIDGFSLHADVHILENDRLGLERLLCYGSRAPIALDRLSWRGDGTLLYRTKRTSKRGEPRVLVLTPLELLRKLAAIIPPPRSHTVRYSGIFAPSANGRNLLPAAIADATATPEPHLEPAAPRKNRPAPAQRERRLDWAALMMRTFAIDVLACHNCGGRLRVMAFIAAAGVARRILEHLGLPHAPPALASARDPPRPLFDDSPGPDCFDPGPSYDFS